MFNGQRAPGGNYFASLGSTMEFAGQQSGGPPNGVFEYVGDLGKSHGLAEITDGSSNTIAFGEWRTGSGNINVVTIPTDIVFLGSFPAGTRRNDGSLTMPRLAASFPQWISQCAAAAKNPGNHFGKSPTLGQNWSLGLVAYSLGNVLLGPNPKYPNCSTHATGTLQTPRHVGAEQQPPRRRQHPAGRWLGPVPEGHRQPRHGLGPRLTRPGRDPLRGPVLNGSPVPKPSVARQARGQGGHRTDQRDQS